MLGAGASAKLKRRTREVLDTISPEIYKNRVKLVNDVDVRNELAGIETRLLYIQATRDLVVMEDAASEMQRDAQNLEIERVEGSHMILQTQPKKCAELIAKHVL